MSVLNDCKQFYSIVFNKDGEIEEIFDKTVVDRDRRIGLIEQLYNLVLRKNIGVDNIIVKATRDFVKTDMTMDSIIEKYGRKGIEEEIYEYNAAIEELVIGDNNESIISYIIMHNQFMFSYEVVGNIQERIDSVRYKLLKQAYGEESVGDSGNGGAVRINPDSLVRKIDDELEIKIPKYFYNKHGINCDDREFEEFVLKVIRPYLRSSKLKIEMSLNSQDNVENNLANVIGYFNYLTDKNIDKAECNERAMELTL